MLVLLGLTKLGQVLFLHVVEKVNVLLLLPGRPDEVAVGGETFLAPVLPPVSLFEH